MSVCILKQCEIRHNAILLQLVPGEYLTLTDKQEERLISAALARTTTAEDFKTAIDSFGTKAPRDGWDTFKQKHPEQWDRHAKANRSGDLGAMVKTFNEMLT